MMSGENANWRPIWHPGKLANLQDRNFKDSVASHQRIA
jgi:hypothetical protein